MSLLNSLRSIISGKAWQGFADSTFRIGDYNRTSSIDPASMRLLALANGQVLRCAWLNAQVAASCTPRLFRKKNVRGAKIPGERADRKAMAYLRGDTPHALPANVKDAMRGEDAIEILDSEVLDLIRRPNPYQTGTLYRMAKYFHMQLAGDYWAHIVTDAPGDTPYALAPMVPQYVTVEIGRDGLPSRILYGKDGSRNGGVGTPFDPDECVCWKFRPSRTSLYRGEGWLVNAYREAGLLERALVAQEAEVLVPAGHVRIHPAELHQLDAALEHVGQLRLDVAAIGAGRHVDRRREVARRAEAAPVADKARHLVAAVPQRHPWQRPALHRPDVRAGFSMRGERRVRGGPVRRGDGLRRLRGVRHLRTRRSCGASKDVRLQEHIVC